MAQSTNIRSLTWPILLALLLLALLIWLCVRQHAPSIQDDIQSRVQKYLTNSNNDKVSLKVEGREVILGGSISNDQLETLLTNSRQLDGVHSVTFKHQRKQLKTTETVVVNVGATTAEPRSRSSTLSIKQQNGELVLGGEFASQASIDKLATTADVLIGTTGTINNLELDPAAKPTHWVDPLLSFLPKLNRYPDVELEMSDQGMVLSGNVANRDQAAQLIQQARIAMRSQYKITNQLTTGRRLSSTQRKVAEALSSLDLPSIQFASGKSQVSNVSFDDLNRVVATLKQNTGARIEIAGHTDSVGQAALNLALSQRRANSVRNYLMQQGIASSRLIGKGYGHTQPIADNTTAEGRAKNRRIKFNVIVEK